MTFSFRFLFTTGRASYLVRVSFLLLVSFLLRSFVVAVLMCDRGSEFSLTLESAFSRCEFSLAYDLLLTSDYGGSFLLRWDRRCPRCEFSLTYAI